jgi:Tfp pilus assembly protein PilE
VIIGILASIAIPKFANTKEKAILASMKSDLRHLVTEQEGFWDDNKDYAGGYAATQTNGIGGAGKLIFQPSQGNVLTITYESNAGWSAVETNPALKGGIQNCGIFVGSAATPNAAVTVDGSPACW